MALAYALRGPPLAFIPSDFYGVENETFGLSVYHERHSKLIKSHLERNEVWHSCCELQSEEDFSLRPRFVVHLECVGDQYKLFQDYSFVVIATNGMDHFAYSVEIKIPVGFSFPEYSVNIIAALLSGDKELQGILESKVENGSAEKRAIEAIEVVSCEWKMTES